MSDEMIALLWTFVVLLVMVAWIPFLELIKFLARRYFSPKIGRVARMPTSAGKRKRCTAWLFVV